MDHKVVVATRFFEKDFKKTYESVEKLDKFSLSALTSGADHVLVAINVDEDQSGAVERGTSTVEVDLFSVQPWGKFAMPLNAILLRGREHWAAGSLLLLASVEVTLSAEAIDTLVSHMDDNTLVVGAALLGHEYEQGRHFVASGRQTPWNTLALWNPLLLWNYGGFPLLADGPLDSPENAGVEEVITIASIQGRENFIAKLVRVPEQEWDTSGFDGERLAAHEKKMASKNTRPGAQLIAAGLYGPTVLHV